jgi:multiple sugar transport system ATP-binding protein
MARIELKNICKRFSGSPDKPGFVEIVNPIAAYAWSLRRMQAVMAVNPSEGPFSMENLNLTISDGKVMVILGPSGCGKSTLLRLIAGLIPLDSGEIYYDGVNMKHIPPSERKIGMIFQNYALYPHFTSKKNILSYFLFKKKTPELDQLAQEKYQKTSELLGVDIEYLMDRSPAHLSGGEKQRVALGRCITRDPELFLLDEPFSNLDQKLREKYRTQLKRLLHLFNITTVYVTHDQQEALILADVLAIMNIGSIEQVGTPEEIYNHPQTLFVADFLNLHSDTPAINILEGEVFSEEFRDLLIGVRSEDITVCEKNAEDGIEGIITEIRHIPLKRTTILCVKTGKNELYVRIPLKEDVSKNGEVRLRFGKYHFFDKDSGRRVRSYPEE